MNGSRGIMMMIWGKPQYGFMACQLAMSLKHHSPLIPIHLVTDSVAVSRLRSLRFFDSVNYMETPVDPAAAKIDMYHKMPFEHTLWMDADGLCLAPMDTVFESMISESDDKPFRCFVHAYYNRHDPDDMPLMVWAKRDVIWDHYRLTNHTLPATQSSLVYVRKCEFSENIYRRMQSNYANRLPLDKLKNKWGGTQPDELYLNITLAQMGYDPQLPQLIYFCDNRTLQPHQIKNEYKILSFFGTASNVPVVFERHYDKLVAEMVTASGYGVQYKWKNIKNAKHANTRMMKTKRQAFKGGFVRSEKLDARSVIKKGRTLLFTTYFQAMNKDGTPSYDRQKELDTCLSSNIANEHIDHIYVIDDSELFCQSDKVTVRSADRPTYREVIQWANSVAQEDDVVVIANSDIYFDHTIQWPHTLPMKNTMIALSRWDILRGGARRLFAYEHSQDTWLFKGKINVAGGDYYFGLRGCDNRFAYEAQGSGYKVVNTAKDILTYHLHNVNVRSGTELNRLHGDYLPVYITSVRDIKENKLLIRQPGKVGDIINGLPIANHYAQKGYIVEWECPHMYHHLFGYTPYVTPLEQAHPADYVKIIDISFGLNLKSPSNILWTQRRKNGLDSFVTLKYELASVPLSELRNLKYNRNIEKETELFNLLHPETRYALAHYGSDYGGEIVPDTELPIIRFEPIEGYSIFDWRKVIEKADEIHCIDSSLLNFVDGLTLEGKLFYYPIPARQKDANQTLMFNKWDVVQNVTA